MNENILRCYYHIKSLYFRVKQYVEPKHYIVVIVIGTIICLWRFILFEKRNKSERIQLWIIQSVCLALLVGYIYLILVYTVFSRDPGSYEQNYSLILFWSYREISLGNEDMLWQVIFNIGMFIPIGVLFSVIRSRKITLKIVVLFGSFVSLTIEILQLLLHCGTFEFDDIFHNILGAVMGFLLYQKVKNIICETNDTINKRE